MVLLRETNLPVLRSRSATRNGFEVFETSMVFEWILPFFVMIYPSKLRRTLTGLSEPVGS